MGLASLIVSPSLWHGSDLLHARAQGRISVNVSGSLAPAIRRASVALAAAVLAFAACPSPAHSQEPANRFGVWIEIGIGAALSPSDAGVVTVQVVGQKGSHHLLLRTTGLVSAGSGSEIPGDVGVLYGTGWTRDYSHVMVAAGVAWVTTASGESTVGIPLLSEIALEPLPVTGLGLQVFANLNTISVQGGAALALRLGWLP